MRAFPGIPPAGWLAAAAGLLLIAPVARAVPDASAFSVDVASYPVAGGGSETVVFVAIPRPTPEARAGDSLRVEVEVLDLRDRRVGRLTRLYPAGGPGPVGDGFAFSVPPGRGLAWVRVGPEGAASEREIEFMVPTFGERPLDISDPVFGVCVEGAAARGAGEGGGFRPYPARVYGVGTPPACVRYRLRDGASEVADTGYRVRYEVKDGWGRTRLEGDLDVPRAEGAGEFVLSLPLASFTAGDQELEVEVRLGEHRAGGKTVFRVDESRPRFLEDPEMLVTVLGYVATNEELFELEEARVESLEAVSHRFWARRDPDPAIGRNEALAEFLDRLDHVIRHFGVLEPGWRSDRGRVYIQYGEPDRVERVNDGGFGGASEIWYYSGRNVSFRFRDDEGYGKYRLVSRRRN